jgi:hypothetical protein
VVPKLFEHPLGRWDLNPRPLDLQSRSERRGVLLSVARSASDQADDAQLWQAVRGARRHCLCLALDASGVAAVPAAGAGQRGRCGTVAGLGAPQQVIDDEGCGGGAGFGEPEERPEGVSGGEARDVEA